MILYTKKGLKNTLGVVYTIITTVIYTIILGTPTLFIALVSKTGKAPYSMGKVWAWLITVTNRVKVQVEGMDNIIRSKSYVFISNHASHLDALAICRSIPHTMRFVAKRSLAKVPIFGWCAKLGKIIFIDRGNSKAAIETVNKAIAELKDGISAFFFAEGTRSLDGKLLPFKKGGVVFAIKSKLPIVPITIVGSYKLLPKKCLRIRPGTLKIIVGKPIDTAQYTEKDRDYLLYKVRETIRKNLDLAA